MDETINFEEILSMVEARDALLDTIVYAFRKSGFPAARVSTMNSVAVEAHDSNGQKHIFVLQANEQPNFDWDKEMREYEVLVGDTLEEDVDRLVNSIKTKGEE